MARKTEEPILAIFQKPEGSGIWWIRYTDRAGQYKREKVGARAMRSASIRSARATRV